MDKLNFQKIDFIPNKIPFARPSNLYDLLQLLKEEGLIDLPVIKCTVLRSLVPALGGPAPQLGKQAPYASLEFLKTVRIEQLTTALLAQEKYFIGSHLPSSECRRHRCALKKLVQLALKRGFIAEIQKLDQGPKFNQFNKPRGERRQSANDIWTTGRRRPEAYALGTSKSHYISVNAQKILGNSTLNTQLQGLDEYLTPLRKHKEQVEAIIQLIRSILGWLHDVKGIPLSQLDLTLIIPFEKLRYSELDFSEHSAFQKNAHGNIADPSTAEQTLANAEAIGRRRIERAADGVLRLLEDFFMYRKTELKKVGDDVGLSPATKRAFITACVLVAEFLYRNETKLPRRNTGSRKRGGDGFDDIPIIVALRRMHGNYPIDRAKTKKRIKDTRCITWKMALEITEKQRRIALIRFLYSRDKYRKCGYQKRKKKDSGIALEIQKFLALVLMICIPTDRQQTYRSLRFGVTLKNGYFSNRVVDDFVDLDFPEDPDTASLWINLSDFKTADVFGDFWYPVPNLQFIDGTTLYQHLASWLVGFEDKSGNWPSYYQGENSSWQGYINEEGQRLGWRASLKPEHDFLFTMPTAKTPYNEKAFYCFIRQLFVHFTQDMGKAVAVSPHSLRHMLATHLDELEMSDREKKSFAYVMHHSEETHEKNYIHRTNQQLVEPAVKRMEKILNYGFFTQ